MDEQSEGKYHLEQGRLAAEESQGIIPNPGIQVPFRVTRATGWRQDEAKRRLDEYLQERNTRTIAAQPAIAFNGASDSRWWFFYVAYDVSGGVEDPLKALEQYLTEIRSESKFFFPRELYREYVVHVRVRGESREVQRSALLDALKTPRTEVVSFTDWPVGVGTDARAYRPDGTPVEGS